MAKQKPPVKSSNKPQAAKIIRRKPAILDRFTFLPYIIISLIAVLVYLQTVNFGLVKCDDHEIIEKDFNRISNISAWHEEFQKSYMYNSYYRPLVTISYMFNAQVSGQNPWAYHLTNLLIHCLVCFAVYNLLKLLKYDRLLSLAGVLIYAVHPLFVNSVAWIVGRNDLMCAALGTNSVIFLMKYNEKGKPLLLYLHILFFLFAVFSKETALLLPMVYALYIILYSNKKIYNKTNFIYVVSWIAIVALWYFARSSAELGKPVYRSGFDVFLINLRTIPEYIGKFVLPADLSVLATFNSFNTIIGLIIICLLIILSIKNKEKRIKYLLFGAGWFLIFTIPGMFLRLLNAHEWNDYLECRSYLPMLGMLIIIMEIIPKKYLNFRNRSTIVITAGLIIILSILTIIESRNYVDNLSYYESAAKDAPDRANFRFLLAKIYNEHGKLDLAEKEMTAAAALKPNYYLYVQSLGAVFFNQKKFELAKRYFIKSLELSDKDKTIYIMLGMSYFYLDKDYDAIKAWQKGLSFLPGNKDILYNLTNVFFKISRLDSAIFYTELFINAGGSPQTMSNLYNQWAVNFAKQNQIEKSVILWKNIIAFAPDNLPAYQYLFDYYMMVAKDYKTSLIYCDAILRLGGNINKRRLEFLEKYR